MGELATERRIEATLIEISTIAHRVARKAVGRDEGPDIAQDVVLECFLKLRSGEWQPDMPRIRPMVVGIVRRRAANILRGGRRRQQREAEYASALAQAESPHTDPDLEARLQQFEAAHTRALGTLPKECRRVYLMVVEDQSTHQAAADRLGVSRQMVSEHYGKAQRRIRRVVSAAGFPDLNSIQNDPVESPHRSVQEQ